MNTPLRDISDRWAKSIATSNAVELKEFYERMLELVKVRANPTKYGDNADVLLFTRHCISKDTIRECAMVGERITKTMFAYIQKANAKALADPKNKDRPTLPITSTHLRKLARLSDDDDGLTMQNLIRRTAEEGLTCAQLSDEITKLIDIDNSLAASKLAGIGLRPTVATSKVNQKAIQLRAALDVIELDEFLERMDSVKPKDVEKSLAGIDDVLISLIAIREGIDDKIVTFESARQTMQHRLEMKNSEGVTRERELQEAEPGPAPKNPVGTKKKRKIVKISGKPPAADGVRRKKKKRPRTVPAEV